MVFSTAPTANVVKVQHSLNLWAGQMFMLFLHKLQTCNIIGFGNLTSS